MNIKTTINEYYKDWFKTNKIYNEWAKLKGLTPNEIFIISVIDQNKKCTQKDICDSLYLSKQTVNNVLENFLKKNYIKKTVSEKNKREKLIQFTKMGEKFAKKIIDELNQFEEKSFNKLTEDERKILIKLNKTLINELDWELKKEKERYKK